MPDSREKRWQFSIRSILVVTAMCGAGAYLTKMNAVVANVAGVGLMVASVAFLVGYGLGGWRTAAIWALAWFVFITFLAGT